MAKMSTQDRARLLKALHEGGLSVVTHRHREELPEGIAESHRLNQMVVDGLLRLDRVTGDRNDPGGERRYEYKLTTAGKREAK